MSLLSKLQGYRCLIVNGAVAVAAVLAALHIIPNPLDAADANAIANSAEAIANAADNVADPGAVSAGVIAAYALVNIVLRFLTKTPVGKKA